MEDARPPASEWTIPPELAALPNWVLWRSIPDENGREQKVLWQAKANRPAKSNTPSTWSPIADVLAKAAQFDNRIGFVFRREDKLTGIDIDGAVCDGAIAPWAMAILKRFDGTAYCEFSPSGTGIHVITRGNLPAGGKNKKLPYEKTTAKEPGLEVYDHGRYFTFTGDAIGGTIGDGQAAIDWLWATHWPAKTTVQPVRSPVQLDARIARYLATIEPTVCGTASCHNRTMWAARCLVTGFSLDQDTAAAHLAAWAATGQHQWSEKELLHKIHQAATTPSDKPAGWLLTELQSDWPVVPAGFLANLGTGAPAPKVVVDPPTEIIAHNPSPSRGDDGDDDEKINLPGDPGPLSHDFFAAPGLIQEMITHHIATAPRPRPELSLAATLAMLGTLTGRKIKSFTGMRTNVYCIGLADSGSGKETPRANTVAALTAATVPKYLGSDNPASDSALVNAIAARRSMLIQIDEVSKFFSNIKDAGSNSAHLKTIFTRMLELTGASQNPCWSPKNFADGDKDVTIPYPHLCIYGTSTGEGFWRSVKSSDATDGFLARFMVIEAPALHPRLELKPERQMPQTIIDIIKDWDTYHPGTGNLDVTAVAIPFDSAALDRLHKHNSDIEDKLPHDPRSKRPLWSRASALAQKLAMIFAASRGPHGIQVTLADMQFGIRLANWSTRLLDCRIFTSVSENPFDEKKKRVLAFVRERQEVSWREFVRKTQWLKDQTERNGILKELLDSEYIAFVPQLGKQLPRIKYLAG